ncbi:MAG TPA: PAS domain S-box protein [Candidatus Eisenbacteria bacterium]
MGATGSSLFAHFPHPAWIYDTATLRFLEVNPAAVSSYGYSRDEFLAMSLEEIRPPAEVVELRRQLARIAAGGPGVSNFSEVTHRRKDGSTLLVEISSRPIRYHGRPARLVTAVDITDRARATAALRASEEQFRTIADNLPAVVWMVGPDGLCTWTNQRWLSLTGTRLEDNLGAGWAASVHPDDRERAMATFGAALASRAPLAMEFRVRTIDGTTPWFVVLAEPRFAADGSFLGYIGTCTEAEAIRQARETVRLYEQVVERMTMGLCVWHLDDPGDPESLRLVAANPAASTFTGLDMPGAIGRSIGECFTTALEFGLPEKIQRTIQTGAERDLGRIRYSDDRVAERVFDVKVFPLPGDCAGVVFEDVTAESQSELATTRQKELLETIFDHIPVMIALLGPDGIVKLVNGAFRRTLGYTLEDVRSPEFLEMLYPDPEYRRQVFGFIEKADGRFADFRTTARDGHVIEAMWANVRLSDGSLIGIGQDQTERKRLEDQLRQAQKLESVGRLAGGVAHDFNNLLTVIIGFVGLGRQQFAPDHPVQRSMDEIGKAADRAAALTRQLLAFSRKEVIRAEALDLGQTIGGMSGMLRRLIGEDIRLHTEIGGGDMTVLADRGQIDQVVMNLAVNARDAMPQGGDLHIGVDADSGPRGASRAVHLSIRDTGCGMTEDVKRQIFEPFFTTKPVGEGTGLGLATVYGIVHQAGGTIDVESEPGMGTTFHIRLPLHARPAPAAAKGRVEEAAPGGGETVLVIEDEDAVRRLIVAVLQGAGYAVLEAAGALDAIGHASDSATPIDLILSDLVMPGLNGREVVERVEMLRPDVPKLYMSGYTNDAIVRRGIETGDAPFLQKPFSPAVLLRRVREILDGGAARRRSMRSSISR